MYKIKGNVNFSIPLKLEWGCGNYLGIGYTGVDIRENTRASIICDKEGWKEIPNECASEIRSEHNWEHMEYEDSIELGKLYHRILVPGGICRIYVPDLSRVVPERNKDIAIMYVWGKRDYENNYHHSWWNFWLIKHFLTLSGFKENLIKEIPYIGPNHEYRNRNMTWTLGVEVFK